MGPPPWPGKEAEDGGFQAILPAGFDLEGGPADLVDPVLEDPGHIQDLLPGKVSLDGQEGGGRGGLRIFGPILLQEGDLGRLDPVALLPTEVKGLAVEVIGQGMADQDPEGDIPLIVDPASGVDFNGNLGRGGRTLDNMNQLAS